MSARRLKRSPHAAGGVASSRIRWRRALLRMTRSACCSSTGARPRSSSVQRTVAWRTASSRCAKIQSAAQLSLPCASPVMSMPASSTRPSAVRRTSSTGPSMTNCSKPSRTSERGDSIAITRARRRPSRPWASSSTTSLSSKLGTSQPDVAAIEPMRTGTPSSRPAVASSCGRNSAIRGTIQPCSAPQAMPKTSHIPSTRPSTHGAVTAASLRRREERGVGSVIAS